MRYNFSFSFFFLLGRTLKEQHQLDDVSEFENECKLLFLRFLREEKKKIEASKAN